MKRLLLFSNPLINVGVISWVAAQLIKTCIDFIKNKKLNTKRLAGAGGMPSSHSSVTCSVLLLTYYLYGYDSPYFALAFITAFITMYDAVGVRWSAGLHAKAINHIVTYLEQDEGAQAEAHVNRAGLQNLIPRLNESLGHRVIEVICGAVLGFMVAIVYYMLVFR